MSFTRMSELFRLLGQTRPVRVLSGQWWYGKALPSADAWSHVVKIEPLGYRRMVDLQTTTGTFIAEGFVSHNSTYWQARSFHQTAFHNYRNGLFLAHDEPSSIEIFGITKAYYDALPLALKPRTKYDARQKIEFIGRNSKILSAHAANINVAAGQMYHLVHITEAARYPNPDKVQASSFPSISEARGEDHSIVAIESTSVFGGDWFKSFADAAARGENEYEFHFIPWFQHDAYTAAVPADFEPTHEEREWRRKYGLTNGQIAWWRQMAAKYASNPSIMRSEFPFDWESSWVLPIGTLRVFTDKMMLDAARGVRPPEFRALATSGGLEKMLGGPVEVWEAPQPGVFYHAGIDLAEGRTEQADWSVGCVVRRDTLAQVAQFRVHENPPSTDFLDLVYWLGMTYNCAEINPDITGGWGNALLTELQYRNYPNIWRWRRRDDVKQRVSTRIGFLFTKRDKAHLVGNAVALATRGEVRT